jgi:capsular polysaccharide biosynthesis protein
VKSLVAVEPPLDRGPFSLRADFRQEWRGISPSFYRHFVKEIRSLTAQSMTGAGPKHIFIVRKADLERPYNQEELIEVAHRYGLELVEFADMSFAKTVAVMRDAELVVGAHGAGWTNLLFARPGARGIMWTQPDAKSNNNFSNLAAVADVDLRIHWMSPTIAGSTQSSKRTAPQRYRFDPEIFDAELQSFFGSSA